MVEMNETANILNNASSRSLIILDEIGKGTSTYDGVSLAWAIAEYIHDHIGAKTLFATHYHQLNALEDKFEGVSNYNITVKESEDKIIFLRKIVRGGTDKSYGIHVAKLAGIPNKVVKRSREIMRLLELEDEIGSRLHNNLKKKKPISMEKVVKNNDMQKSLLDI
jgi:DNA mismatch repair protein MutS